MVICTALLLLLANPVFAADEWPQFRGPDGQGHTAAKNLPLKWSETEGVVWKTPIPGRGHSSPVISGEQIWLTTAVVEKLTPDEVKARLAKVKNPRGLDIAGRLSLRAVLVHRESGKVVKNLELLSVDTPEPIHSLNSYSSPSPVIENGRLYCHFGTYGTVCVNAATGSIVWRNTDLHVDHQNGPGSTAIVWDDLVIANFDGIDKQFVAAFSKHTGKLKWRTPRSGKLPERPEFQKAYATPIIVQHGGQAQLISPGSDWVYSYDPATGKELWRAAYGKLGFSTVPRPVVGHGLVYIATSYMRSRLVAVKYDGRGDVSTSHIAWTEDRQIPSKPSLLLVGEELYMINDGGIASCLDAKTGKLHWRERVGGKFSASPLYGDGKIYFFSQEGKATVIAPGKKYRVLAVNELAEGAMASPAVAGKALFVRTDGHLYRIEK